MIRGLMAMMLVLVLCAFGSCQRRGGAPIADAGAMCYQPCTPSLTETGVVWEGDPEDPAMWDRLGEDGGVIPQLSGKLLTCEARRQECAGFINSLKKRGVIRAKEL